MAAYTYAILLLIFLSLTLTGYGKPRSSFRICLLSNKKVSCRVYLGYSVRKRQKFSKTRCPYNTNGLATFNIVQLCGDVQPNPGPDDGALKPTGNLINRVTVGASIPTIVSSYRPRILRNFRRQACVSNLINVQPDKTMKDISCKL